MLKVHTSLLKQSSLPSNWVLFRLKFLPCQAKPGAWRDGDGTLLCLINPFHYSTHSWCCTSNSGSHWIGIAREQLHLYWFLEPATSSCMFRMQGMYDHRGRDSGWYIPLHFLTVCFIYADTCNLDLLKCNYQAFPVLKLCTEFTSPPCTNTATAADTNYNCPVKLQPVHYSNPRIR